MSKRVTMRTDNPHAVAHDPNEFITHLKVNPCEFEWMGAEPLEFHPGGWSGSGTHLSESDSHLESDTSEFLDDD